MLKCVLHAYIKGTFAVWNLIKKKQKQKQILRSEWGNQNKKIIIGR